MANSKASQDTGAVVPEVMHDNKPSVFTEDDYRNVQSFEDAAALLGDSVDVAEQVLGDGFALLEDKDTLIGVPVILMEWSFNAGDFGDFVSVRLVAKDGRKLIMNDGSTGIMAQLRSYTERTGRYHGLAVRRGLRRSDYTFPDPTTGKDKPAKTYYLDTSA